MKKILLTAVIVYLLFCLSCVFANHFELYGRPKPSFFLAGWPFLKDLFRTAWEGNDFTVVPVIFLVLIFFVGLSILVYRGLKHFLVIALLVYSSLSYGQTKEGLPRWVTELQQNKITANDFQDFILAAENLEKMSLSANIRQARTSDQLQERVLILEQRLDSLINTLRTQQWLGTNPYAPWIPFLLDSAALRRAYEVGLPFGSAFIQDNFLIWPDTARMLWYYQNGIPAGIWQVDSITYQKWHSPTPTGR